VVSRWPRKCQYAIPALTIPLQAVICGLFDGITSCSTSNSAYSYTFLHSCTSCTLLKLFDRFWCHFTIHTWDTVLRIVLDGGAWPPRGEIWGSNPQPKHAIANCCWHLANTNEKQFRFFQVTLVLVECLCAVRTTMMRWHSHRCRSCGISMERQVRQWLAAAAVQACLLGVRLQSAIIPGHHRVDVDQPWGLSLCGLRTYSSGWHTVSSIGQLLCTWLSPGWPLVWKTWKCQGCC